MMTTKIIKTIEFTLQESGWYRAIGDSAPFPQTLKRQPTVFKHIRYEECLSCYKKYFSGLEPTDFEDVFIIDTYRITQPKKMAVVSFCDDSMKIFLLDRYPHKRERQRIVNHVVESSQYDLCPA